jgi:methionyl-tRNA formyltransferase
MRILVFTSNQPRHISLINRLASIATEVFAIQECNTVFPGKIADFFGKSAVMQDYFARVIDAERRVFGDLTFTAPNVRAMSIKMGDVSMVDPSALDGAIRSADHVVVFGASYIKGPLVDHLIEKRAVNIHMGCSPWYRGSSTNFWAMYDRRPEYVGATIHRLSKGLDSGEMLFHAFPPTRECEPFEYGMLAVKAAHEGMARAIESGALTSFEPVKQDRTLELRYTRNADFSDEAATDYLSRLPTAAELGACLRAVNRGSFLRPFTLEG